MNERFNNLLFRDTYVQRRMNMHLQLLFTTALRR